MAKKNPYQTSVNLRKEQSEKLSEISKYYEERLSKINVTQFKSEVIRDAIDLFYKDENYKKYLEKKLGGIIGKT